MKQVREGVVAAAEIYTQVAKEGKLREEYLLKGLAGKMPIRVQMVDYRLLGVVLLTSLPMLLVDM